MTLKNLLSAFDNGYTPASKRTYEAPLESEKGLTLSNFRYLQAAGFDRAISCTNQFKNICEHIKVFSCIRHGETAVPFVCLFNNLR